MRVVCQTVDEFLECLKEEPEILQNTVRVSIVERPVDKGPRDSIKYEIVLQASAVVCFEEGGQYLLEVGIDCGTDVRDADPSLDGTIRAQNLKARIKEFAENSALKIMPGMIQI